MTTVLDIESASAKSLDAPVLDISNLAVSLGPMLMVCVMRWPNSL